MIIAVIFGPPPSPCLSSSLLHTLPLPFPTSLYLTLIIALLSLSQHQHRKYNSTPPPPHSRSIISNILTSVLLPIKPSHLQSICPHIDPKQWASPLDAPVAVPLLQRHPLQIRRLHPLGVAATHCNPITNHPHHYINNHLHPHLRTTMKMKMTASPK